MTRQQLRRKMRKRNKRERRQIRNKLLIDTNPNTNGSVPSNAPMICSFFFDFTQELTLQDYIHACKECAEVLKDTGTVQYIFLMRGEGLSAPLPASKREIIKIGTRIFRKKCSQRPYIFLECVDDSETCFSHAMDAFMKKLKCLKIGDPRPEWMSNYML